MKRKTGTALLDEEMENKDTIVSEEELEGEISALPDEEEEVRPLVEELEAIEEEKEKEEVVIPENLVWTYLRSMGKTPLLAPAKEIELLKEVAVKKRIIERLSKKRAKLNPKEKRTLYKAKKDYERAKSDIVTANLRLVVSIARRYQNRGLHLLDLIQEGNIGAVKNNKTAGAYN